ncbi:MAG TPA: family 43 glycosylhydrolase [Ignavibacteriaceae bacterium]|nr:family 43 glycosylhydrolase [Ignavibacteriaceae bacterium]
MPNKKRYSPIIFFMLFLNVLVYAQPAATPKTFCNPMNLNYRFMVDAVDAREAADPVMVLFKGDYYLFASRSGGYWTSPNLRDWTLIIPTGIDIETYAPAVVVMRDSLFYIPSATSQIYKTGDPKSGVWTKGPVAKGYGDPDLFLDNDGKLYMYYGLSNNAPTSVVELNPITFAEIGSPVNIVYAQASSHGWERRGDDNLLDEQPWIEGTWMVKENNKYYLHYSAPGTEFKTYADGIYVADSPKGPYQYADYSPFSFKPTGFISGAGHGCTFKDKDGNYWRVVTMSISVKNIFERRLGLFPVSFDNDGHIFCNTAFGDYPQFYPGEKENPGLNNGTGMMLLSNKKYVAASSSLSNHKVENAVDEEVRTYWSAQTGNADEWLMIDLGKECDIEAVQINFAEEGTTPELVRGRSNSIYEKYILDISNDGKNWNTLVDKSNNTKDVPHDYIELSQPATARYVKLKNVFTPGNGKFAIRDLRIFGNSSKAVFTDVSTFTVNRNASDGRNAVISWSPVADADGYIVRYGIAPDKLYNNYMVYDADSISIHSLNKDVQYYFSVQAFDSGTDYYKPTGEIKSFKSGNWNNVDTWQRFNGTAWIHPAPNYPSLSDAQITISPGHTITVTANDSADQVIIDSGAVLIINPGINYKVIDGIGTDLLVQGTLDNKGTVEVDALSTLSFVGGGIYIHDQDEGSIPSAEWREGSTCKISGVVSNVPSNGNQNFSNVVWDSPNQSANLSLNWDKISIGGNISIVNTGSGRWQMCSPAIDSSVVVEINGDIIQSGGSFTTNGSNNSGSSIKVVQNGSINVSGGNFSISRGTQGGTGKAEWYIGGDFTMANATTENSNPSGGKFIFNGSQEHNLTLGSGNTLTALPIEVDSGSTLNFGTSELKGSGIFILDAGAAFGSGHPDGINGNLKNTGTKTLSIKAGYSFNGTVAQITGSMMPDEVQNLTMDNSAGITLSKSLTVNGIMEIKKAGFSVGTYSLTYGQGAGLKYSGTAAFTTSDNEFPASNGPENVFIMNPSSSGITLHASRTITGKLFLSGKFRLEDNNFTAAEADKEGSSAFIVTSGSGSFTLLNIGAAETLFPIGTTSYAPVWVTNNGAADNITIRVESDNNTLPEGGRVRAKWIMTEGTIGGGNYTLKFGWAAQLEDSKFRQNRLANAGIFLLASDTAEAGTGGYTTQFDTIPYSVSRGGITSLGTFGVGKFGEISVDVNQMKKLPTEFRLSQNYPNPFNPTTQINYSVPKSSFITLKVYNVLGEEVRTLFEGFKQRGNYRAIFDAKGLSSGIYIYQMRSENFVDTKKTILLK